MDQMTWLAAYNILKETNVLVTNPACLQDAKPDQPYHLLRGLEREQ